MYQLLYLFLFAFLLVIVYHIFFVVSNEKQTDVTTPYNPINFNYDHNKTIQNNLTCNITTLQPCSMKNKTSCFGCKNLTSSCQHFESDTKAKIGDEEFTIPANKSPDEGYCLPLTVFATKCNPYHGDFIIGGIEDRYGLFCICKDPGVVTNTELNGPCETRSNAVPYPFVDINVPLDQLQLQCPPGTTSGRTESNIPTCFPNLVSDAGEYRLATQTEQGNFNSYLNQPTEVVLTYDPCKYCLATNERVESASLTKQGNGYVCKGSTEALPIRRDPNARLLSGDTGPDAILKLPDRYILFQVLPSKFGVIEIPSYYLITFQSMRNWDPWLVKQEQVVGGDTLYFYYFDASHQIYFPFSFNTLTLEMSKMINEYVHYYHNFLNIKVDNGTSLEYVDLKPHISKFAGVNLGQYINGHYAADQGDLKNQMNALLTDKTVVDRYREFERTDQNDLNPFTNFPWSLYAPKVDEKKNFNPTSYNWNFIPKRQVVELGLVVGLWFKKPNDSTLYGGYLDAKYSEAFRKYYESLPDFNPK